MLRELHRRTSSRPHASRAVCQAGLVDIAFPPHWLHRKCWPALGTVTVSDRASTLTSAEWLQASHVAAHHADAVLAHVARVIGGPGLLRMACAPPKVVNP
jgi:hypothetical protein